MALRINTNVTALNAHKNLVSNDSRLSKSIERLSSGLAINRAADDAAGLTVSEKLRTQVRGINRAIMNVQDGIGLIQTAEGALNEIQSMLQRMRELALQSGNDTLTTTDRLEIQKEVNQLKEDINRISYGTEFNTRKLLDGTGTAAISTSDPKNLDGIVTGEVVTFSDFSVVIYPQAVNVPGEGYKVMQGTKEIQRSNIFVRTDGEIAKNDTTLQSISNFYDQNGFFILDLPQTLYVQGDNSQGDIIISKDLTLDQLSQRVQQAMTTDQLGNGLDFEGSTAVFTASGDSQGQITVTSGKHGNVGRLNFTGEENLIKALGFAQVTAPEDPIYSIAVTNMSSPAGSRTTTMTQVAGHLASGLIQGIDLMFEPPVSAFAQTKAGELGISIPSQIQFTIDDSISSTGTANVVIPAGTYSMEQVIDIINSAIGTASPTPLVEVRLNSANALEFFTKNTGSAAWVSISNTTADNVLGVSNGRFTGTGGTHGELSGFDKVTNFNFVTAAVTFSIQDRHDGGGVSGLVSSATITLNGNYANGGMTSIVEAINSQLLSNGLQIVAENRNGILAFRSLETGVHSNFDLVDGGNLASGLRIFPGTSVSGYSGNPAVQNFSYDASSAYYGFVMLDESPTVDDDLKFHVADLDGRGMSVVITAGVTGASFRSLIDIVNTFNDNAANAGVKVNAEINPDTHTIRFFSTVPGKDGRVVLTDLGDPNSANTLKKTFDVAPQAYQNGSGNFSYTMHVKDTAIQFQIGPNQGHTARANIIRMDTKALGINDINMTSLKSAETAIGLVDKALQIVSSERARLGAIENRMNYTSNSLRVSLENMSAAESRIRDVDVAREVVELTRFQVLQQSSNAMLAQANATSQRVLDLLR